jgi:hypothetical protein
MARSGKGLVYHGMDRTAGIIAFGAASLGSVLLGWAAIHIAAKFEQQRAIRMLEKYGPSPNSRDSRDGRR